MSLKEFNFARLGFALVVILCFIVVINFNIVESHNKDLVQNLTTVKDEFPTYCVTYSEFLADSNLLPKQSAKEAVIELTKLCKAKFSLDRTAFVDLESFSDQFEIYQKKMNILWGEVELSLNSQPDEKLDETLVEMRMLQYSFYNKMLSLKLSVKKYNESLESWHYGLINFMFYQREKAQELTFSVNPVDGEFKKKLT